MFFSFGLRTVYDRTNNFSYTGYKNVKNGWKFWNSRIIERLEIERIPTMEYTATERVKHRNSA